MESSFSILLQINRKLKPDLTYELTLGKQHIITNYRRQEKGNGFLY